MCVIGVSPATVEEGGRAPVQQHPQDGAMLFPKHSWRIETVNMSARLKNEKQFGVSVNLSALRAVHVHLKLTGSLKSQSGVFSRLDRWHKACGRCAVVDLSERFTDSLALRREIVCCHGEKAPDGGDSPSHAPVHLNKTLSPVISLLQLGITTGLLLSHIDHRMRQKILSLCVVTLTDSLVSFVYLPPHSCGEYKWLVWVFLALRALKNDIHQWAQESSDNYQSLFNHYKKNKHHNSEIFSMGHRGFLKVYSNYHS